MNADQLELVGIVVGSSAAGSIVTKVFERRRDRSQGTLLDAEAAQVIANTAVTLVAPLEARVTALEAENLRTKSKLQVAIDHILDVHKWIGEHIPGRQPPQPPSELGL